MWARPVFIGKYARESWGTPSFKNVTTPLYYNRKDRVRHMWLVEPPNPNKIEQCWECIFLKVYTQVITKIASKFFFTFPPLRKPRLSKMASIKTNKIKKRTPLLFINF